VTALTGSYNGLNLGPAGDVAIAEAVGLDDLPELRTTDQDRPGEGMVPGSDSARRRTLAMTLLLIVDTPDLLGAKRTAVQRAFRIQSNTELPLLISNTNRQLYCRPRRLTIDRDFDACWRTTRAEVELEASDPWWYDASDTALDFTLGTPATFFPLFPLRLSASEVFADATVNNDGDVDAWPVWSVTGPGAGLVLRNLTTGKMLSLNRTLSAGEIVTIDTRPRLKTVTLQDGSNLFSLLSGSLWPLAVDVNAIRVEFTGATSASVVSLRYRRRRIGIGV
jgi:hypothetical protein